MVWEDEADPDNAVLAVLHVYALIPTAEGLLAADVFGLRPEASVEREIPLRFAAGQIELEHFPDEEALSRLIEREEGDGAPLAMIDEAQIRRAEAVALNLFPDGLAHQDPMVPGP